MCERHSSLKMLFYKCVDSGCGDIFYQMEWFSCVKNIKNSIDRRTIYYNTNRIKAQQVFIMSVYCLGGVI